MVNIMSLCSVVLMLSVVQCVSTAALKDLMDVLLNKRYDPTYYYGPCEYPCRRGHQCLAAVYMCNGYPECWDRSDEDMQFCEEQNLCLFTCPEFENPKKKRCVKKFHLCDGSPTCEGSIDEKAETCEKYGMCKHRCTVRRVFPWQHYDQCLPESKICNFQVDCADKSDEKHETCVKTGKEHRKNSCKLLCPGENEFKCVTPRRFCDGYNDCPDSKADELLDQCKQRQRKSYDLLGELLNMEN